MSKTPAESVKPSLYTDKYPELDFNLTYDDWAHKRDKLEREAEMEEALSRYDKGGSNEP